MRLTTKETTRYNQHALSCLISIVQQFIIQRSNVNAEKTRRGTNSPEKKVPRVKIIRAYSGYTCDAPTFDNVRMLVPQIYPTCDFAFHATNLREEAR